MIKKVNCFWKWILQNKAVLLFGIQLVLLVILQLIKQNTLWVELVYARRFFPYFAKIQHVLFSWVPFSVGDVLYGCTVIFAVLCLLKIIRKFFQRYFLDGFKKLLCLVNAAMAFYLFFYVSWGLNYYRQPVSKTIELSTEHLKLADFLELLHKEINLTNQLRTQCKPEKWVGRDRQIRHEMENLVRMDTLFSSFLSTSNPVAKQPLESHLVSYFGVSGYFNPFTHEAQVNLAMPVLSKPFTYVHEMAHQQGIGFEDEANFIAYLRLRNHKNPFYAYSAHLQTTVYLLRALSFIDKNLFLKYKNSLSERVLEDLRTENVFWENYMGWFNSLSNLFYNEYLQHNNQQEGILVYDRMVNLVLAYELKSKKCL